MLATGVRLYNAKGGGVVEADILGIFWRVILEKLLATCPFRGNDENVVLTINMLQTVYLKHNINP